jgi:hypothetical protein
MEYPCIIQCGDKPPLQDQLCLSRLDDLGHSLRGTMVSHAVPVIATLDLTTQSDTTRTRTSERDMSHDHHNDDDRDDDDEVLALGALFTVSHDCGAGSITNS